MYERLGVCMCMCMCLHMCFCVYVCVLTHLGRAWTPRRMLRLPGELSEPLASLVASCGTVSKCVVCCMRVECVCVCVECVCVASVC